MGKTIRAKKSHGKDNNNTTTNDINKEKRKEKKRNKGRSGGFDDTRELSCILEQSGLTIYPMDSDGNCLFRSIADQLTGNPELHMIFRNRIMKYIETHSDHFKLFMEDDESFDDYLSRMNESNEWGGHHELYAASQCLNINITVYQLNSPVYILEAQNDFNNSDKSKPIPKEIKLSYHGECHYNSVRRMDNEIHTSTTTSNTTTTTIKNSCNNKMDMYIPEEDIILVHNSVPWIERSVVIKTLTEQQGNIDTAIELLCADISVVAIENARDNANLSETCTEKNLKEIHIHTIQDKVLCSDTTTTTIDSNTTPTTIATGNNTTTTTTTPAVDTTIRITSTTSPAVTVTANNGISTTTSKQMDSVEVNSNRIKSYRKSGKDKPLSKKEKRLLERQSKSQDNHTNTTSQKDKVFDTSIEIAGVKRIVL